MAQSFFFYDLETSGTDPRRDRIMQFAGLRTDEDLNPIGEPLNILVTLTPEVLPAPGALLVTGITPQKTKDEGYTEAQFLEIFCREVLTPDTIIIGYNNIRFDDEFMRCTLFRNMYDPYEWQSTQGRSRWDMLDVVRLTRALRPEGIEWPFDENGVPSNRLEHITRANGIEHEDAHDALSDVYALINVAKLIKDAQPKLYDYLLKNRHKNAVQDVIGRQGHPFVHTAFIYPKEYMHTSVVAAIAPGKFNGYHYIFDLRFDPEPWINMSAEELRSHCQLKSDERTPDHQFIPVSELKCNQCPAVAPYSVLQADAAAQERLNIDLGMIKRHFGLLQQHPEFGQRVAKALEREFEKDTDAECQLYDGFIPDGDKSKLSIVRNKATTPGASELKGYDPQFADQRLQEMFIRYKARNYPYALSDSERSKWEQYRNDRLEKAWPGFLAELQKATAERTGADEQFILEELKLYAESLLP